MFDNSANVRENYDRIADEYANHLFNELQNKPFDRQLLEWFAAEVRHRGRVCDIGCGPGHIARYLRDAGIRVFGLDLSPGMLEQARRLNPDIEFCEGNMVGLPILAGSLAGITAFYAVVNTPEQYLSETFSEMNRVLQPGGRLLLSFHVGDETIRPSELWGRALAMDFFLFRTAAVRTLLEAAGFVVEQVFERAPYPPEVDTRAGERTSLRGKRHERRGDCL